MSTSSPADGGPHEEGGDGRDLTSWADRRSEAARVHDEALAARRRAESAQAQVLIDAFLVRVRDEGPAPSPLRVRSYDGRRTYRTPLSGWTLRRDGTVGIDTEGRFYVLTAPAGLGALLRGVDPVPTDPPLVIGAGGRDGDSIDLADALERALREG
ncbi:hypothetical protein [Cellulomonas marina]|uniref:Uncharacterized protein n=1 Tax=Cellulomonas marina TaxID=988821 RepID=A0A1I1AV59_9CELL|nr:hypothetical protein [Cellulomonas marina]GIG30231.1 hypothetical protein Cma02nite_28310 [Cellulomonas marina]SFB41286.1 hypothetical protein SAMN05421867_12244 [Cellulomonas marina]